MTLIIADTMKSQRKTKTVPALEVRRQLSQLMKEIRGGARVLVEKFGIPMIGMISAEEFQRLVAEREARFEVVERIRQRLPAVDEREVQRDVGGGLKVIRRCRRA